MSVTFAYERQQISRTPVEGKRLAKSVDTVTLHSHNVHYFTLVLLYFLTCLNLTAVCGVYIIQLMLTKGKPYFSREA